MEESKKAILLADDVSDDLPQGKKRSHAVRIWANAIARSLKRKVELIHVEDLTLYPVSNPYYKAYIRELIQKRKEKLKSAVRSFEVPAKISFLEGYPIERISELAAKRNAYELIVLGSHGHKRIKRALLGSVAEEVIRNSKIPVLVVGPTAQRRAQKLSANFLNEKKIKIVLATDLGKNAKKAESYANSLAQRLGAEVTLFYSLLGGLHPAIGPAFTGSDAGTNLYNLVQKFKPDADSELKRRKAKFEKQGIKCSVLIDEESMSASSALLDRTKKIDPSLIIMGTHGRSSFVRTFLGSTSRELILRSPYPIIVVPG